MNPSNEIKSALEKVPNMALFAGRHALPLRTLWRVRSGSTARKGTLAIIEAALRKERLL